MNALKGSYQPVLALGLLAAMGSGPKALQDVLLQTLSRNATSVMTNVPGPQEPLYLAGAAHRQPHVLGAAVGRHRHGRVDHLVQRRRAVRRSSPTAGCAPIPSASATRFGAEFEKLVLIDADGAVAARRRARSARRRRPRPLNDGVRRAYGHAGYVFGAANASFRYWLSGTVRSFVLNHFA